MLLRLGVTAAVLAVTLTAAGGALAIDQTVTARPSPNRFDPAQVTINQGEKVTWTNAGGTHNVKFDDGLFEQPVPPTPPPWPVVERIFNSPGVFSYVCAQHPMTMSGSVTVLAAGAPGAPPGNPPGTPPGGAPPGDPTVSLPPLRVTLKVSDSTLPTGERVRLFGVVRPARDGRKVQVQKRAANGGYRTVAATRLRDAGAGKSKFSLRLKVSRDAVFRARVNGDDERATGISAAKRVDAQPSGRS
jgi:plastocyanin